jgi:predicted ATPase
MTYGSNIPTELTSFVGRKREVADIQRLLAATRLLTLTGTAGCGKTRLALRVSTEAWHQYPDGILWISLAQLSDPDLVPMTVAKKLDVSEQPDRSLMDGILEALHDRHLLLVLASSWCKTLI